MRHDSRGYTKNQVLVTALIIIGLFLVLNVYLGRQEAMRAADEAAAVDSLRTIITALISYDADYQTVGFAPNLSSLGGRDSRSLNYGTCTGNTMPTSTAACLIDSTLAAGTKSGYRFVYEAHKEQDGVNKGQYTRFEVRADPVTVGVTGTRHYFADETADIRVNATNEAGPSDPKLEPGEPR